MPRVLPVMHVASLFIVSLSFLAHLSAPTPLPRPVTEVSGPDLVHIRHHVSLIEASIVYPPGNFYGSWVFEVFPPSDLLPPVLYTLVVTSRSVDSSIASIQSFSPEEKLVQQISAVSANQTQMSLVMDDPTEYISSWMVRVNEDPHRRGWGVVVQLFRDDYIYD